MDHMDGTVDLPVQIIIIGKTPLHAALQTARTKTKTKETPNPNNTTQRNATEPTEQTNYACTYST